MTLNKWKFKSFFMKKIRRFYDEQSNRKSVNTEAKIEMSKSYVLTVQCKIC